MKYTITYVEGPLNIVATADDENERKEVVKGIKYTIADIAEVKKKAEKKEAKKEPKPFHNENEADINPAAEYTANIETPMIWQDKPITDKQKKLLAKYGVSYDYNITSGEAHRIIDAVLEKAEAAKKNRI